MIQHVTTTAAASARGPSSAVRPRGGSDFLAMLSSLVRSGGPPGADATDRSALDAAHADPQSAVEADRDDAAVVTWPVGPTSFSTVPGACPSPMQLGPATHAGAASEPHGSPTDIGALSQDAPSVAGTADPEGEAGGAPVVGDGAAATVQERVEIGVGGGSTRSDREVAAVRAPAPSATSPDSGHGVRSMTTGRSIGDASASSPASTDRPTPAGDREGPATARPAEALRGTTAVPQRVTGTADAAHEPAASILLDGAPGARGEAQRTDGPATTSVSVLSRLLDAIEQLEQAPPPRQLTLELGELRVRLALEDGALRLQLLGDDRAGQRELLEEAAAALLERGFDLHDGGSRDEQAAGRRATGLDPDVPRPRAAARTASRLPAMGMHL
jgi:hypothetical protein